MDATTCPRPLSIPAATAPRSRPSALGRFRAVRRALATWRAPLGGPSPLERVLADYPAARRVHDLHH